MPAKSYYLRDALTAEGWRELSESTQAAATINASGGDGWIVGTGTTNHSKYEARTDATERASTTFDATTYPTGTLDTTLKDAFRITSTLNGDFASGDWEAHLVVRGITSAGAHDGRARFRIIKADADGSNATEITSAQQQGAQVNNISSTADFDSNLTFNPGAFSISNQYLFVQIAWERIGAGGMTTTDVHFRTGVSSTQGTRIITADFTDVLPLAPLSFNNYLAVNVGDGMSTNERIR